MADPTANYVFPVIDTGPGSVSEGGPGRHASEVSTDSAGEKQSRSSGHESLDGTDLATRGSSSKPATISDETGDPDVFRAEPLELQSPAPAGRCQHCCRPLLRSTYNVGADAPLCHRLVYSCSCPPWGGLECLMCGVLLTLAVWGVCVALTGKDAMPGGQIFGLLCVVVLCLAGGWLVDQVRLPPLLGMLIVGIGVANIPGIKVIGTSIHEKTSSLLRNVALMVILTRAGLGLDAAALRRLSVVVVRLAFSPCLSETLTIGIAAHLLLGFPWIWSFMLGFVLAAVSPAVVVPCLLQLQDQGWGCAKGIPTLVIAASSCDDVLAISGFGVLLGICFSQDHHHHKFHLLPLGALAEKLLSGPLEVIIGLSYGIATGVLLWFVPERTNPRVALLRMLLITCLGLLALFGSQKIGYAGAGALGSLTLSFVAGHGWRQRGWPGNTNPVSDAYAVLWFVFQPILFGLIGTEIKINALRADTVGYGVLTLAIGLTVRVIVTFFVVLGAGLSVKERLFVAIAWVPKATVQAAIGSVALDYARLYAPTPENIDLGEQVVAIAVLVILITAPIGAAAIMLSAPRLLTRGTGDAPGVAQVGPEDEKQANGEPA